MPFIIEVSWNDHLEHSIFSNCDDTMKLKNFFSSGYSEIVSLNEMYIITKTSSYTDSPDIYPCFLPQESEIAHALFKGI